jgi:CRISPR-associated endoribonuclease Cas6
MPRSSKSAAKSQSTAAAAKTVKPARRQKQATPSSALTWAANTELVGLVFEVEPVQTCSLYAQYTIGLHAWFLEQVRLTDPELSATLHDDQAEKAFTISGLEGALVPKGRGFQLQAGERYRWSVTGFAKSVVEWMAQWMQSLPTTIDLRDAPLQIKQVERLHPATTYKKLWELGRTIDTSVTLSFISPTSFRRHGQHFPLPVPFNLYHSYLRRWNLFSEIPVDADEFLDWVDESILVLRHRIESTKVLAGKRGSVTGFTGVVEFGISPKATIDEEFIQLFYALSQFAPYCGTGHKTTFGLGQTRLGEAETLEIAKPPVIQDLLGNRITELTEYFMAQRKRTGGERATQIAETWATILARRELGESLIDIAEDLEMNYETVKSYAKLARRSLQEDEG